MTPTTTRKRRLMLCSDCGVEVLPIVCLDLDGTLGQYHAHFLSFMNGYFGRTMPDSWNGEGNWEDYLGLSRRDYEEVKLAFRQGGMKRTMPIIPGAWLLSTSIREAGAEIWITTTRPYNRLDSVDPDTREWLRRNKIQYDHLLYDDDKYGKLEEILFNPERVVAILDDLPEQYDRAEEIFGENVPILKQGMHNEAAGQSRRTAGTLDQAQAMIMERIESWT